MMTFEKSPSSLTLSLFSLVVEEVGGRIERMTANVCRETQAAFANIFDRSQSSCWVDSRCVGGWLWSRQLVASEECCKAECVEGE